MNQTCQNSYEKSIILSILKFINKRSYKAFIFTVYFLFGFDLFFRVDMCIRRRRRRKNNNDDDCIILNFYFLS